MHETDTHTHTRAYYTHNHTRIALTHRSETQKKGCDGGLGERQQEDVQGCGRCQEQGFRIFLRSRG